MACNSRKPCSFGNINFLFVTERKTFNSAQQSCVQKGGTLANFLGRNDYEQLNKCCNSRDAFWIGLVDKNRCKNTPSKPYQWIQSTNCRNGTPLIVQHQPNNQNCQAVAISFTTHSLPETRLFACSDQQFYICKIPKQTTTTTKTTTTSRMKRKTTQALPYTTPQPNSIKTLWSSTERNIAHPAIISRATKFDAEGNSLTHASTANPGAIVGAVLGSLAVVILVILLLLRCKNKDNRNKDKLCGFRKKENSLKSRENNTNQADQNSLYCNITTSPLAHKPGKFLRENYHDGTYLTINEDGLPYQNIKSSDCKMLHLSSVYFNVTTSSIAPKPDNSSAEDFNDSLYSTVSENKSPYKP